MAHNKAFNQLSTINPEQLVELQGRHVEPQKKVDRLKGQLADAERLIANLEQQLVAATGAAGPGGGGAGSGGAMRALTADFAALRSQHREALLLIRKYEATIRILADKAGVSAPLLGPGGEGGQIHHSDSP